MLTTMKKFLWFTLTLVLMCGCKPQTPEQIAEKQGQQMKAKMENKIDDLIKNTLEGTLEHPESYQPISTDLSYVMSNMAVYDSKAFVALRDLDHNIEKFNKLDAKKAHSLEANKERETLKAKVSSLADSIQEIQNRPVEFEAIHAYHQFYAKDKLNRKLKRGYHFIIHKDNRTTLLCDQEQLERVQAFAEKLLTRGVNVIEDE